METYKLLCPLLSLTERNFPKPCRLYDCAWYAPEKRLTSTTVPGGCALRRLAITLDKIYREV